MSIAARLRRAGVTDIAVVDPNDTHFYKPLFSHIAGGTARGREATRPQRDVLARGVAWVKGSVVAVDAPTQSVRLESGTELGYDQLILAPGIVNDWDAIPGLSEAITTESVASNYEYDLALKASPLLRDIRSGTVVFVQASGPGSCVGAAQKPMYQACAHWRAIGVLDHIHVVLLVPEQDLFPIPEISAELRRAVDTYGIDVRTEAPLRSVDAGRSVVTYGAAGDELAFDVLMVEPPQIAPAWIATSGLADGNGFVDVDPETLVSRRDSRIWALGDAAETLSYKSGGALRKQTSALADNVLAALRGEDPPTRYAGYGVCPFTVSRSTAVFAEFDRDYQLTPTLWRGSYRESRRSWIIDRYIFPQVYWRMILQGRA